MREFLRRNRGLLGGILAVALVALVLLPTFRGLTAEELLSYTPESLPLAALVFLGVYCAKSFIMVLPVIVLYAAAGMLFPTGWAFGVTYFCLGCELTVGYLLGHHLGRERVAKMMERNQKVKQMGSFFESNSPVICFLSRMIPVPLDLMNLFFGATGMPFLPYLFLSLLGLSPYLIPCVLAGDSLADPLSKEFLLPFGVSLLVALCTFLLFLRLQKRQRRQ